METASFALLNKVQEDLRVGPAHISLMAAILKLNEEQSKGYSVQVTGRILRGIAHIGGKAAYYRYLSDLQRFGYIKYVPFYNHKRVGRIEILVKA
ncbi:hypothetical protein A9P82_02515 [Arachidicoccus ginsenosidimutans]|uniref:hypothetical protein n=1 Tax=Arachidicoccus sp. BS20 TaxID=1850526 RepID=UPI0007F143B7|nr:hypothetical protein [Arachidicoccus sp. BS20]ANI88275.1 hypothetical protein A9P82_02515 [Arachidicoccus sp. BS20]